MYEEAQAIFEYLPIRRNQLEDDYMEHLWQSFSVLSEGGEIVRPFAIMPFHLLFMLAVQYKVLRISQIHKEACELFFCGVAGRSKKELLSDQLSVFDIALINERTIPEIFQLIDLGLEKINSIKKLIDDRNDRLAHAKGGIEQEPDEKIILYIEALQNIQNNFYSMNKQIAENLLSDMTIEDDITQLLESLLSSCVLDENDLVEVAQIFLKSEKPVPAQWIQLAEYLLTQFNFDEEMIKKSYPKKFNQKNETYTEDSLFFDGLPNVSTNQMLDIVKASYPAVDPYYIASACVEEKKHRFDTLWREFEPYADRHFRNQVKINFHQRTWEMYVGNVLLGKGLSIQSKNEGPDFVIDKTAYIECVAPTKGDPTKPDSVPEMFIAIKPEETRAQDVPVDKMVLRITQAIKNKANQYENWKSEKWFDTKIPFIVAINTGDLSHVEDPSMPNVLKALFGFQFIQINIKTGAFDFSHRNEVPKTNNESVPVNYFVSQDFDFISGVLFSDKTVLNHPENIGEDCIFVNNPFAKNSVNESFVGLFRNWRASKEDDKVSLKKNY
jgi:hypothetical protein